MFLFGNMGLPPTITSALARPERPKVRNAAARKRERLDMGVFSYERDAANGGCPPGYGGGRGDGAWAPSLDRAPQPLRGRRAGSFSGHDYFIPRSRTGYSLFLLSCCEPPSAGPRVPASGSSSRSDAMHVDGRMGMPKAGAEALDPEDLLEAVAAGNRAAFRKLYDDL